MILVALGANLPSRFGAPEETLETAKGALEALGVQIIVSSRVWHTAPVPVSDQPWFRNAVISVETTLGATQLLELLQKLEAMLGRVRDVRNAPRVIDLDLLAYNDELHDTGGLTLPHPRMERRGFVLYPLQEVAPNWIHPRDGRSIDELIADLPPSQALESGQIKAA